MRADLLEKDENDFLNMSNLNQFKFYYEISLMEIETARRERRERKVTALLSKIAFASAFIALAVSIIASLC